jgi:hypothetical protein
MLVLTVQAEVVSMAIPYPWALDSERLVVGNIGGETAKLAVWQFFHNRCELSNVVFPSEPATVSSIKVHRSTRGLLSKRVDGIFNAFLVRLL